MPSRSKGPRRKAEKQPSADQVLQDVREEAAIERWERGPKKQYVRINGWVEIIRNYIEKRRVDGVVDPIRYFTLPGRNAMDVGLLRREGIIFTGNDGRLNVAICDEGKGSEIANKLSKFGEVLAFSDRLLNEELRESNNPIPKIFPFDVINLDFCNSLFRYGQDNLESISWVFERQLGRGFLLLLTAREYPNVYERYLEIINQNIRDEVDFSRTYVELYGDVGAEHCAESLRKFSQIVYPKAVGRCSSRYGYRIFEHFVAHYYREPEDSVLGGYNMVCHSFELEPIGRRGVNKYKERYKHIANSRIDEILQERISSTTRRIANEHYTMFVVPLLQERSEDIDQILEDDPDLRDFLEDQGNELVNWIYTDD